MASSLPTAKLLFVTDPLCSWCWGTLPEIEEARRVLTGVVDFDLIMGGLQIGPPDGLVAYDVKRLNKLWKEVTEITGQTFSNKIPEDFVYHSEIACRSVELARIQEGEAPWEYFHKLQAAFYLQGRNVNDPTVLADLLGRDAEDVREQLKQRDIVAAVRQNMALATRLSANALPNLMLDTGEGMKLLCGGYVTAEYLIPEIEARLTAATVR